MAALLPRCAMLGRFALLGHAALGVELRFGGRRFRCLRIK